MQVTFYCVQFGKHQEWRSYKATFEITTQDWYKRAAGGGLKVLKPPLSNQNIDVYFLSFSLTL